MKTLTGERRPLYVCSICGPKYLHYCGPIVSYVCPDCIREHQAIVREGGMFIDTPHGSL